MTQLESELDMEIFTDDEQERAEELDLYAWNTSELYETRKQVLASMAADIKASAYDAEKHVKAWCAWYAEAAKLYRKELPKAEAGFSARVIRCAAVDREEQERKAMTADYKIEDLKYAIVEPDNLRTVIDFVHPLTRRSLHMDETIEEVRKRYPSAVVMAFTDWQAKKAARQDRPVEWTETTEEVYDEQLGCLPPACFANGGFLVGEPADHHAVSGQPRFQAYRVRDGKFFASSRAMTIEEFKNHDG